MTKTENPPTSSTAATDFVASETIRWGIIGCGDVVERKAASGLVAASGQSIVSAMRNDEDKLHAFAKKFDVPHTTTNPQEVVSHPDVDMVYIATPPDLHLQYAQLAVAAGKGVLIEKPAGRCAADTRAIAALCEEAGVPGYASYYRRYQEKFQKIKALLQSGAIGPLVSVHYEFRERRAEGDNWRADPARSGGGRFYDLAGHVLDLIDLFCGPLEFVSGDAHNLVPVDITEHFSALHFRGRAQDGSTVPCHASWNFAAIDKADELVIEGFHGRIRCSALKQSGAVVLEVDQTLQNTWKGSWFNRTRKKLRNKYWPLKKQRWQFAKPDNTHLGLFEAIGRSAGFDGDNRAHLQVAVRTAQLMDGTLENFYGGREVFWEHPQRWQNLSTTVRAQATHSRAEYAADVDAAQIEQFKTQGYAGPYASDIQGLESVFVPVKERKDVHLKDPQFFRLCTHPSITERVAALVGTDDLSIFKTRIHTKVGFTSQTQPKHAIVPWHQDVGGKNGGYDAQDNPVPTYTVWIALDDVGPDSGPLCILPGTHTTLYGDYRMNFHANLLESGALTEEEVARAIPLVMKRGEFLVFHSWLLHGSSPNDTPDRRAGFNIRYVENARRGTEEYPYVDLSPF